MKTHQRFFLKKNVKKNRFVEHGKFFNVIVLFFTNFTMSLSPPLPVNVIRKFEPSDDGIQNCGNAEKSRNLFMKPICFSIFNWIWGIDFDIQNFCNSNILIMTRCSMTFLRQQVFFAFVCRGIYEFIIA